jgi:O-antigen/teichoic acid export membrane protein
MKAEAYSPSTASRVISNTVALIGGEFFYHFINFLTGILIARSLGSDSYGQWSFIFVYLSFFEMVVKFGMDSILTRWVAQNPGEGPQILGNALLFRFFLAMTAIPGAIFFVKILGYPLSIQEGVFLAAFQLFLGTRSLFEIVFRVNLLMMYPALWNGMRALVNLLLVFWMADHHRSVSGFIYAYLASGFLGLVGLALFSRRFMAIRFRFDGRLMKALIRESGPLVVSGYLTLLYYRLDVLMLSKMKGFSEVGYYSVATRLTESLTVIATSLMASFFPLLARAFRENRTEFESLVSKALKWLLLLGLPIALGGSFVARELIVLLFGTEYAPSGLTLGILLWYTFFGFLSILFVNLLIVCGRQIVDTWISLFLVLANAGMNFWLIPRWSYNGAAAATVLVEVLGSAAMGFYLTKHPVIRLSFPPWEIGRVIKTNVLFLIFLCGLKGFVQVPVLWFVLLAGGAYVLLLFIMKLVSFSDFRNNLFYKVPAVSKVTS